MKTRELLQRLLNESGMNPNSLSVALRGAAKQPQIHKFLKSQTTEPKRSTLAPIANFYGISVEAFFDEEQACALLDAIADGTFVVDKTKLGRKSTGARAAPFKPLQNAMGIVDALDLLADRINEIESPEHRELLASRLQTLARAPDSEKARNGVIEALAWADAVERDNPPPAESSIVGQVLSKQLTAESKDFQPGRTKA